jgi:tetratricopeptide (TPR) repeat protein
MNDAIHNRCADLQMQEILAIAAQDTLAGLAAIDATLRDYPEDARLHFLKGSMLIGEKRFIAAHTALREAVRLDPELHIARFQLGFFELTSGEAEAALVSWQPLKAVLPAEHYLQLFVEGLEHLVADRFIPCIESLQAGMAVNAENTPLNGDMQLIIDRCRELLGEQGSADPGLDAGDGAAVSATSFLLGTSRRPN